ncbi:hypothetical protein [Parahaliea aestuarii]|uniref:Uncharacterized protein n=1 Tax=Parahaliea aestuarii TaxID=1852021 RepID=A0A5C8ZPB8_9GAMM|nr:hypothetical protein [Parahaliea aestuarii]TXS89582.1 hypothetical protein FVW59_16310 [Parahaliea aestuarii]
MESEVAPFYADWTFWAVVVAFLAVVLSQLPPVLVWFKRARLEIELYSKIAINHKVGNPNLQLHLIIENTGGRNVRIRSVSAKIKRDGNEIAILPAQNYLQNQGDKNTLLFTPFSLSPGEVWAHNVNFLIWFSREEETVYRKNEAKLQADFKAKRAAIDGEPEGFIELNDELVQPFHDFFAEKYIWEAGEYHLTVEVNTNTQKCDVQKTYRFTLFESHVAQLKEVTDYFKYAGGISWDPNIPVGVLIDLKEV